MVAIISLTMTERLVEAGAVAETYTITGATNASPIVLTFSSAHNFVRPVHAVVSGVGGNTAANGTVVMTPVGVDTVRLSRFQYDGTPVNVAGNAPYTSGGTAETAFPDGCILLGRRNVALATAPVSPRFVFVPIGSSAWTLDPYGAGIPTGTLPRTLAAQTTEQQSMKLARQLNTEPLKFEVHVTGCASPPDPDFGDFDFTQALYRSLFGVLFDLIGPARARVTRGDWVSQARELQTLVTHGQKWMGIIEIDLPVTDIPLSFVPMGTVGQIVVNFDNGSPDDQTVLVVP